MRVSIVGQALREASRCGGPISLASRVLRLASPQRGRDGSPKE